ncbi:MAG: hypothetical protein U0176_13980 [Bacteroidia bacterium]
MPAILGFTVVSVEPGIALTIATISQWAAWRCWTTRWPCGSGTNLFTGWILGGDGVTRTTLMETLVLDYLVNNYGDTELITSADDLKRMVNGRVVLPREVFPLLRPGSRLLHRSRLARRWMSGGRYSTLPCIRHLLRNGSLNWKLEETLRLEPEEYRATEGGQ